MLTMTSTRRVQTLLVLIFCLALPAFALTAQTVPVELPGTTEARSAMDPDGVV